MVVALFLLLCSIGCATLICGGKQRITVNSEPSGANVTITFQQTTTLVDSVTSAEYPEVGKVDKNVITGKTPMIIEVRRKRRHLTVVVRREGYDPYRFIIVRTFNTWVFGNIILGGVLGLAVDLMTGAVYELSPGEVNAILEKRNNDAALRSEYPNMLFLIAQEENDRR